MTSGDRIKVLIAGGGVAGLEALLALRRSLSERARIEVLAPEREFRYRQLSVAEPFSLGEVARYDLSELISGAGGIHRQDALGELRASERVVSTLAGAEVDYDALLLALGARPRAALAGAIAYRGVDSNEEVRIAVLAFARGEVETLGFAVPPEVRWSLPIYELALLTAAHLADIGESRPGLAVFTHEPEPLAVFGRRASDSVSELLDDAGIAVHAGVAPARLIDGRMALVNGSSFRCDRAIALPALEVQLIPGVPQGRHGFIDTDSQMRVAGLDHVYAAGDATWFPIKQGGIAAQQADTAAVAIAAEVDPDIEPQPFRPVLRAAMLTGAAPRYLRVSPIDGEEARSAPAPMWWPPSKVAGQYLAPYIADHAARTNQPSPPLIDLDEVDEADAGDHREAVDLALAAADAEARWSDYRSALRWLEVAEQLDLTLDPDYLLKREQWQREIATEAR
jgi:sulfide:quinone oxidoreductase